MKRLRIIFVIYIMIFGASIAQASAQHTYSWAGIITTNQTLYLSDGQINATLTVLYRPVALIEAVGTPYFLLNGTAVIGSMSVMVQPINESTMSVTITSDRPFSATFWPIVKIKTVIVNQTIIVNQTNETKIKELEALLSQLNATLLEKEALISNLTARLNTLRAENSKLNATVDALLRAVQNKTEVINALESEKGALLKQVSELKEENTALIAGWNATNSTLKEKEALISQLNANLSQEKNLTANFTLRIQKLKGEKAQLERQVEQLKGQIKDYPKLQARLLNLTRENREFKVELANLTQRYNNLKGENDFLRKQNAEYKGLISSLLEKQSRQSTNQYLEEAKKEKLIGSVLLKTIIFSLIVVGLIGYLLYRKKKSWELGGL